MTLSAPSLALYPLEEYKFLERDEVPESAPKDGGSGGNGDLSAAEPASVAKTAKEEENELRERYAAEGQQRHVTALLVTHHRDHPHVLLREDKDGGWGMIGGKLVAGETDEAGVLRILRKQVSATEVNSLKVIQWDIVDLAAQWWRPSFNPYVYPYIPAHISNAKESIKIHGAAASKVRHANESHLTHSRCRFDIQQYKRF